MAENQEQAKPDEREIPVFTVLKNDCILKNIFLLDNPPSMIPSSSSISVPESVEEVLVVGRHPDCNIKLEHPSISRFHLRIHSNTAFRSLYVTDLSSVHGTWISGKRIEPGVQIKLNEGDMLHLGASSRLYRLNWVPLSHAYDIDNPFVPHLDASDRVNEETDEPLDQDTNISFDRNGRVDSLSDLDGLERLFSDQDFGSSTQKTSPPLMPQDSHNMFSFEDEIENNSSPGKDNQENELSFEIKNSSPRADRETMETYEMNSEKKSGSSIWSRRGKTKSVQIETSKLRGKCAKINVSSSPVKPILDESESILKGPDNEEENFMPDKENTAPDSLQFRSSKSENEEKLKNEPILYTPVSSVDRDEELSTPEKENMNMSLDSLLFRSSKSKNEEKLKNGPVLNAPISSVDQDEELFTPDKENMNTSPDSLKFRSLKSENKGKLKTGPISNAPISSVDGDEEIFTPYKENMTPNSHLLRSSKSKNKEKLRNESILNAPISSVNRDEESFTPDKENMTPNTHLIRSVKNSMVKNPNSLRSSPLKMVYNMTSTNSSCTLKARANRDPFCPLPVNSHIKLKSVSKPLVREDMMRSIKYPLTEEKNTTKAENRWIIVVDTASLLNKKSRNELQLLRGLRGTQLVIPRIVVRELDCMLRRASFFTRTSDVSAALQYIEECLAVVKWWIHIQSSAEEGRLIPPTPPASPHWFGDDMWASSIGSAPFSPCSSLQEIVTPTAADHILDYVLYYKRIMKDGQLVLLTDDVTLKIKAMAEGVLCETAQEFRRSLVNPFSTRFLYSNCSPIGPTWSCADDTVLKEKYYPSPPRSKKTSRSGEGAKGLKLILLHNSSFRQIRPVS